MPRKQPKSDSTARADAGTSLDVEALRQIIEILEASEVTRLVWTNGTERVSIRRGAPVAAAPTVVVGGHHAPTVAAHQLAPAPTATHGGPTPVVESRPAATVRDAPAASGEQLGHVIASPFVGTFYRSPAPDQPSFAEVGSVVKKGQVLCIIEAMKLMNEIESEVSGKVVEVLAQNAQPVEFGQPLFRIEPS